MLMDQLKIEAVMNVDPDFIELDYNGPKVFTKNELQNLKKDFRTSEYSKKEFLEKKDLEKLLKEASLK